MKGTWMSCFCCPTLTCCTSCKLRHDALYCWVVADSGRYTAREYDDATKQFFRPCCIHHQRTDSSKWEHYQACFQCQQMVCLDEICMDRHLTHECPMREDLAIHRAHVFLNKQESAVDQQVALENCTDTWWKERVSPEDREESPFAHLNMSWTARQNLFEKGLYPQLRRRRSKQGAAVYAQTMASMTGLIGSADAESVWTTQLDTQFLSAVQSASASYARNRCDEDAHNALAKNKDVGRVLAVCGRFLVEAAEWVGTQKWTSAMNDMFSSFEQLYAETLKCLKEREDEL